MKFEETLKKYAIPIPEDIDYYDKENLENLIICI